MQSIRKRSFSGDDGSRFAKLVFPGNRLSMMVREEDLDETIRRPIAKKTAKEVLDHIGTWDQPVSDQWKTRASTLQAKLDDGDPFALAEVYKTLVRRQATETLSAADRRQLSQSEARLSEEIAMAFGHPLDKALQRMENVAQAKA